MNACTEPGTVGPTMRSWHLRGVLALACAATAAAVAFWTEPAAFALALLVIIAVVTVIRPDSHAATVYIGLVAFLVLANDPGMSWWTTAAVFGVHATHTLAALAAVIPWDTVVERSALRPSLRRFILVQAAGQSLVLLALAVTP
jgi:cell division protein FtsW (lipid II flippase)